MRKLVKYMALTGTSLLVLPSMLAFAANYSLVPAVNYVNAGNSRHVTTTFTVMNKDTEKLVLAISVLFQGVGTETGGPFQQDKSLVDPNKFSLLSYVKYSPQKLSIASGDSRTIRLSARLPGNLPAGTYRLAIDFSQQSVPAVVKNTMQVRANQVGAEVIPLLDQIGSLYINVGNGSAQTAQVSCNTVGMGHIQLKVTNNTNWNFNPSIDVYSSSQSHPLVTIIPIPLMPQSEGVRDIQWTTTDKGPYKITWSLKSNKTTGPTSTLVCQ